MNFLGFEDFRLENKKRNKTKTKRNERQAKTPTRWRLAPRAQVPALAFLFPSCLNLCLIELPKIWAAMAWVKRTKFLRYTRTYIHKLCVMIRSFVRQSIHPSVCRSVRPSVGPFVRSFVRPSVRLFVRSRISKSSTMTLRFREI